MTDQFTWSYVCWLRSSAGREIESGDWLFVGHCRTQLLSARARIATVGEFAPGGGAGTWMIVADKGRLSIEHQSEMR
jgi:hypothetical protein